MKKWVKVELKPKLAAREDVKLVRFLCNYAGFMASNNESRIPYKVVKYGLDWVLVLLNGRPIYVHENLTIPCQERAPKKVQEEVWYGN